MLDQSQSPLTDAFIFDHRPMPPSDTLDSNGFELYVDYNQTIAYNGLYPEDSTAHAYFPVFVVNATKRDKLFFGIDRYVFGRQEANDRNPHGNWKAIETKPLSFCGNGHWKVVVQPKEYILLLLRKYHGSLQTAMRVRLEVGENTLVSKPFQGWIDKRQFGS